MTEPAVSVAMSVFNGERFLPEAIESILAQTMPDFEFLILNDGSSDSSRAIIDGYAGRDARIRAVHRENRGLIASLNQLVEEARAPIVARMDADDRSKPDRFARQISFLRENPDHGVLGSWSEDIDEDGNRVWLHGEDQPVSHEDFIAAIEADKPVCCHPSVMMKRSLVLSVGGYHAAFRYCEDYDLWLRLAQHTKLANLPVRLLQYRQSPGQITKRHVEALTYGTIIARFGYDRRKAGLSDPTETLAELPPYDQLPELFGDAAIARSALDRLYANIVYSPVAMAGPGFDGFLRHLRNGGNRTSHWRTVARLAIHMRQPLRAARLASLLTLTDGRNAT